MVHSIVPSVLRYVDQVARSGSIQGAAKELNIAASAIDRHILQIEDSLGARLFDRVPRGMRLTVIGESIVTLARRWRDDERRALAEIRQLQGVPFGIVQLAAMDSHATSFLPALVEHIASTHRLVSLSIELASTDEAVSMLLAGKADLAAVFNLPPRREFHVLWRDELPLGCVVAAGHPLARGRMTVQQYLHAPHLVPLPFSAAHRGVIDRHLASLRVTRNARVEVPFFTMAPHMLVDSDLIFTISRHFARHYAVLLPLAVVECPIEFPRMRFYQMWHGRQQATPAHRWLRGVLKDVAAATVGRS